MSSLIWNMFSCINARQRGNLRRKITKITFGATRNETFERDNLPSQLKEMMIHLARTGVLYRDLFRRPGNPLHMRNIIKDLQRGKRIEDWNVYNPYTLANVIKRYMLSLVGGLLNHETEIALLDTLHLDDDLERWTKMRSVFEQQPQFVQKFLVLLLGIWFLMTHHDKLSEVTETQAIEGLAKAVAGSLFFNCGTTVAEVERAAKATEFLISGFATSVLLKPHWIQYFCNEAGVTIVRIEKHVVESHCPANYSDEECLTLMQKHVTETARKFQFQIPENEVSLNEFNEYNDYVVTSNDMQTPHLPTPKRRPFIGECTTTSGGVSDCGLVARLEIEYVTVNRVTSHASLYNPHTSSTLLDIRTSPSTPVPTNAIKKGATPLHNDRQDGSSVNASAVNADLMWLLSSQMDLLNETTQRNGHCLNSCGSQDSVDADSAPFPSARSWTGGKTHQSPDLNSHDAFFRTNGTIPSGRANSTEFLANHDYDDVPLSSPEEGFSLHNNSTSRGRCISWTSDIYDSAPPLITEGGDKIQQHIREPSYTATDFHLRSQAIRHITDCDYDEVAFIEQDKIMTRWFIVRHVFAPSSTPCNESIST